MSILKTLCSLSKFIPPFQQKRQRKIFFHDFFQILITSVFSNTGIKTLVNSLQYFNPSNFYRFRNKITDNYFQKLNTFFQNNYCCTNDNSNVYFLDAYKSSMIYLKLDLRIMVINQELMMLMLKEKLKDQF